MSETGAVDIADWVRQEQEVLWDELQDDLRNAINGTWSIASANRAARIVSAARLVGPTPPDSVPWDLVAGGVYFDLLDLAAVDYTPIPDDEFARLDALMASRAGSADVLRASYAATRAALRNDAGYVLSASATD